MFLTFLFYRESIDPMRVAPVMLLLISEKLPHNFAVRNPQKK